MLDYEEVAAVLGLPAHVFGSCVGYPDPAKASAVKPRLPQSAVLHHETYDLSIQDKAIADYNQVMQTFYTQQQMNVAEDWSEHSAKRVASPESLSGRDRLREALHHLGFELR